MDDLQQRALKEAEAPLSKLTPKRIELEQKIAALRSPADDWLIFKSRQELKGLNGQIETAQLEVCALRIRIKQSELVVAREAIQPLQAGFDAAMNRYGAARREADAVGFELQQARAAVSGLESAIRENQTRIETIQQARARRAA
jgi:chromosome segregation ATPase